MSDLLKKIVFPTLLGFLVAPSISIAGKSRSAGIEVVLYSMQTGTKGAESLYPETSSDVYDANINEAQSGDADSQYWVGRALSLCTNVGDKKEIKALESSGEYEDDLISRVTADFENCEKLKGNLAKGLIDDKSIAIDWLLKSAASNSILGKAWHVGHQPEIYTEEKALAHVKLAFADGDLYALEAMRRYYQSVAPLDKIEAFSWMLTHCDLSSSCSESVLKTKLSEELYPYEVGSVLERSLEIKTFLSSKEGS